jgi:hypothetical protein
MGSDSCAGPQGPARSAHSVRSVQVHVNAYVHDRRAGGALATAARVCGADKLAARALDLRGKSLLGHRRISGLRPRRRVRTAPPVRRRRRRRRLGPVAHVPGQERQLAQGARAPSRGASTRSCPRGRLLHSLARVSSPRRLMSISLATSRMVLSISLCVPWRSWRRRRRVSRRRSARACATQRVTELRCTE